MRDLLRAYRKLDIKAEVILAEMMEAVDRSAYDAMALQPDGGFNHAVSRDIRRVYHHENEHGLSKDIVVLSRPGLFDSLPEGLFYDISVDGSVFDDVQKTLDQVKRQREIEADARKFFSPFDQILHQYRLYLETEERKILTGFPVGARHTLFDVIWSNFDGQMNNYQKSLLFTLMPITHQIVGHTDLTAKAMSAVLGYGVVIETRHEPSTIVVEEGLVLGDFHLGMDFILGDHADELATTYDIEIGPIPSERSVDFVACGSGASSVEVLLSHFLPFDAETRVAYQIDTTPIVFEDTAVDDGWQRLGYSLHV